MVEDVLVLNFNYPTSDFLVCLNPCCGGRCSSTASAVVVASQYGNVLILVVVEDVLVH